MTVFFCSVTIRIAGDEVFGPDVTPSPPRGGSSMGWPSARCSSAGQLAEVKLGIAAEWVARCRWTHPRRGDAAVDERAVTLAEMSYRSPPTHYSDEI